MRKLNKPDLPGPQCENCWRTLTSENQRGSGWGLKAQTSTTNKNFCVTCAKQTDELILASNREKTVALYEQRKRVEPPEPLEMSWRDKALCITEAEVKNEFNIVLSIDDENKTRSAGRLLRVWCHQCPAIEQCLTQKLAHKDEAWTYAAVSGATYHQAINTLHEVGWSISEILEAIRQHKDADAQHYLTSKNLNHRPEEVTRVLGPLNPKLKVYIQGTQVTDPELGVKKSGKTQIMRWAENVPTRTRFTIKTENGGLLTFLKIGGDEWTRENAFISTEHMVKIVDENLSLPGYLHVHYPQPYLK